MVIIFSLIIIYKRSLVGGVRAAEALFSSVISALIRFEPLLAFLQRVYVHARLLNVRAGQYELKIISSYIYSTSGY